MGMGYKASLEWVVRNDDVSDIIETDLPTLTPTMALVADIFGKNDEKVMKDVIKMKLKHGR